MNCPSRTDEPPMTDHPDWNQCPPFLSPDLTTREDLNGIANARERRGQAANAMGPDAGPGGKARRKEMGSAWQTTPPPPGPQSCRSAWGLGTFGPHPQAKGAAGDTGSLLPTSAGRRHSFAAAAAPSAFCGWLPWAASVLLCAGIMSALRAPDLFFAAVLGLFRGSGVPTGPGPAATTTSSSPPHRHARLARRSTCATGGVAGEDSYNTPLHVGAVAVILAVSFSACALAPAAARLPRRLRLPAGFFFGVRHLGTGVLLATAFVHLLPTAFGLLANPCLSSFWVEDYPPMPGAIALAAVFLVAIVEMALQPARRLAPAAGPVLVSQPGRGGARDRPAPSGLDVAAAAAAAPTGPAGEKAAADEENGPRRAGPPQLTAQQQHQKDILQCMMLEVGILFHSVFIGMTLSVSTGHEFVILLVAIAFHQTFEGLALGSRIAAIRWEKGSWQPWMMALAYGCTTPIGQAIGIATHSLYNPESEFGLVLVGTMNAISSGLLVFASLVELLSEDFLSDESWRVLRGRRRVAACVLVLLGAVGMSLVGAWA